MAEFRDPIEDEADAAEGSSVAKHGKALAERMASRPEPELAEVEVQEPDDEEAEELAGAQASRRDKRAARSTARERLAAAEAREQVLREQLEITRRGQAERAPAQASQPGANPVAAIDGRIKGVNKQLAEVHDEWNAGKLTKERAEQLQNKAEALEVEKITLVHQRVAALEAPQRERAEQVRMLKARNPDVWESPAALQYAQGLYQTRTAAGAPDSLETHDAVMAEAREVILGKRPKPDAAQRQRASGIGGGVGVAAAPGAAPKIPMTKGSQLYRLACAQYPDLDPGAACQKWANKNGKAYLENRARAK